MNQQKQEVGKNRHDEVIVFKKESKTLTIKLLKQDLISSTSFAKVFKCQSGDEEFVIKVVDLSNICQQIRQKLCSRLEVVLKIDDPNVVKVYAYFVKDNQLIIVCEYCEKVLNKVLQKRVKINEQDTVSYIKDILSGYRKLTSEGVILQSIKPSNILFYFKNNRYNLKIADLGLSQIINGPNLDINGIQYNSPQYVQSRKSSFKNIVWGLGIIMFQLLAGQPAWRNTNVQDYLKAVTKFPNYLNLSLSKQANFALENMLIIDSYKRIDFENVWALFFDWENYKIPQNPNLKIIGKNIKRSSGKTRTYEIDLSKQVAKGSFGQVYRDGQFAIKRIQLQKINQCQRQELNKEAQIQMTITHQKLVRVQEYFYDDENLYLIMEYCQTDLKKYLLSQPNKKLGERQALDILKQILEGYSKLLQKGIAHRDLKPANIMIGQKDTVKLGDFGLARFIKNQQQVMQTVVGTPSYMSPQLLKGMDKKYQKYTTKSDIWSLGIILYQMLFGKLPWTGMTYGSLLKNMCTKPLQFPKNSMSVLTLNLIKRMLKLEEADRIDWSQLFQLFQIQYYMPSKESFTVKLNEEQIRNILRLQTYYSNAKSEIKNSLAQKLKKACLEELNNEQKIVVSKIIKKFNPELQKIVNQIFSKKVQISKQL